MGEWVKQENGDWCFKPSGSQNERTVMVKENDKQKDVMNLVRKAFGIGSCTNFVVTFQFPDWTLESVGKATPPVELREGRDVELFMELRSDYKDVKLCVTTGETCVRRYIVQRQEGNFIGGSSAQINIGTTEPNTTGTRHNIDPFEERLSEWEPDYGEKFLVASHQVMKEIFTAEEMEEIRKLHEASRREVSAVPNTSTAASHHGRTEGEDSLQTRRIGFATPPSDRSHIQFGTVPICLDRERVEVNNGKQIAVNGASGGQKSSSFEMGWPSQAESVQSNSMKLVCISRAGPNDAIVLVYTAHLKTVLDRENKRVNSVTMVRQRVIKPKNLFQAAEPEVGAHVNVGDQDPLLDREIGYFGEEDEEK